MLVIPESSSPSCHDNILAYMTSGHLKDSSENNPMCLKIIFPLNHSRKIKAFYFIYQTFLLYISVMVEKERRHHSIICAALSQLVLISCSVTHL